MVYELRDGRYHQGPHRCFLPDEPGELEELLRDFEGLVLGHNILNFDYEVLKPTIPPRGMVEKTVDTLGFLYEKRSTEPMFTGGTESSLKGLSLDNLAQRNLGRGKKGISGRSVPKLWREGRREEVFAYNKEDLVLTFSLWQWMVEDRTVVLGERDEFNSYGRATEGDRVYEPWRIEIFPEDLPRLTGQRPLFNTHVVRITGGPVLEKFYDPDDFVYGGGLRWGRHYLRENMLLVRAAFGSHFWPVPLLADEFTFTVEREGPDFPARDEEPIDLSEL